MTISILIKRTYMRSSDASAERYLLAGTRDECVARVERMIAKNPTAQVNRESDNCWRICPPGWTEDDDGDFFGPHPFNLLIVEAPEAKK